VTPLRCRLEDGRLTFEAPAPVLVRLAGTSPFVRVWRGDRLIEWRAEPLALRENRYEAVHRDEALRVELCCEERGGAWIVRAALHNTGGTPLQVEEIAPLALGRPDGLCVGAGVDRWSVFRNGYQSWSGTQAFPAGGRDRDPQWAFLRRSHVDLRHPSAGVPGVFRSDSLGAVKNLRSGEALCLGFLDARECFGAVELITERGGFKRLVAACDWDGISLAPGASLTSAPLWLAAGRDEHQLLAAYAGAAGTEMAARVPAHRPAGWCSWYYYFRRVSEADVLRNVAALAAARKRYPCDYVMVDDGYQRAVGDWLVANAKFPHGMGWLAEQIRTAGFDAGIWLAPFIVRPDSELFTTHPEWILRGTKGGLEPALWNPTWGWRDQAVALDTTHPEVLEWLRRLARTVRHDWGYRILKLDFLFAAALPGVRHDRGATRAQALRRGLEAIRAGAGDDAFLLGCGCPLQPAVGVVDAMRIGPDVAPFWSNWLSRGPLRDRHGVATKHAIRNTLARAFLHRHWWLNDPDCVMVRAGETRLTGAEVRSLATVIALTDGLLVASDPIDALAPDRLALLERTHALAGGAAVVPDLFARDVPELLLSRRREETLVAAFNFQDRPSRKILDVGVLGMMEGELKDAWDGSAWTVCDGWVDLGVLPPHGCVVLRVPASSDE
jgi:alpha-galactosidase